MPSAAQSEKPRPATMVDIQTAISQLETAAAEGNLSTGAVENIHNWLTEPYLEEYAPLVAEHLASGSWKHIDDAFWTVVPFGTGGRRGKMYPIRCNAINHPTTAAHA